MANPVKKKKPTIQGVNVLKAAVVEDIDRDFIERVGAYERYLKALEDMERMGHKERFDVSDLTVNDDGNVRDSEGRSTNYDLYNSHGFSFDSVTPSGYRFFDSPLAYDDQVTSDDFDQLIAVYEKPEGYDEYKKAQNRVGRATPIAAKQLQNTYDKPALKPMTPVKTPKGRATVQVGKLAQDQKNARYGQVLDKEYYWDRELKKWQMRPVDEERKGQPMIRASF